MLLQNMTPEEKLRQVSRLELDVRNSGRSWVEQKSQISQMDSEQRELYDIVTGKSDKV